MYDLIYGASARDGVLAAFPHAVVHDESDWIHDSRISVRLPDEDRECYLKWVIKGGWGNHSFIIQTMLRTPASFDTVSNVEMRKK